MLVTKKQIREAASRELIVKKATTASILHENASKSQGPFDVFLSHSVMDADLILGAKSFLEGYGFTVYVDWIDDPQLSRSHVNATSAAVLRWRMRSSKMLIYVHTLASTRSKWCPWELGFFDGEKGGNVFIFPVAEDERYSFEGQEYLGLYPYVDEARSKAGIKQLWINYAKSSISLQNARSQVFAADRAA